MTASSASSVPLVDLVLRGGRVLTFADPEQAPAEVSAVAIAQGRILACGTHAEIHPLAEQAAPVTAQHGRRVLPGLNDSHIHAVRAGASWTRTMHWEGVRSLDEALALVRAEVDSRAPGQWISVIGGWHSSQLRERRPPTRAELDAAAPEHPVYVQELYDRGVLNSAALRSCGFDDMSADPARGELLRDTEGRLTGEIRGIGAFSIPTSLALEGSDAEGGVVA